MFDLVTGTATKPCISWKHVPNIKTRGNGWSNFSENLRIAALKLFKLTRFLSPFTSIFSYVLKFCTALGIRCDVDIFKLPPVLSSLNEKSMMDKIYY